MDTESRYTERELLAVVYVCKHFHTYLYGRSFIAESDNKHLEAIQVKNLISAAPRLQRMFLLLQPYDATVQYRPGKQVLVADVLSRLSPEEELPIPYLNVQIQSTRPWHTVGTELTYFIFIFLLTYWASLTLRTVQIQNWQPLNQSVQTQKLLNLSVQPQEQVSQSP